MSNTNPPQQSFDGRGVHQEDERLSLFNNTATTEIISILKTEAKKLDKREGSLIERENAARDVEYKSIQRQAANANVEREQAAEKNRLKEARYELEEMTSAFQMNNNTQLHPINIHPAGMQATQTQANTQNRPQYGAGMRRAPHGPTGWFAHNPNTAGSPNAPPLHSAYNLPYANPFTSQANPLVPDFGLQQLTPAYNYYDGRPGPPPGFRPGTNINPYASEKENSAEVSKSNSDDPNHLRYFGRNRTGSFGGVGESSSPVLQRSGSFGQGDTDFNGNGLFGNGDVKNPLGAEWISSASPVPHQAPPFPKASGPRLPDSLSSATPSGVGQAQGSAGGTVPATHSLSAPRQVATPMALWLAPTEQDSAAPHLASTSLDHSRITSMKPSSKFQLGEQEPASEQKVKEACLTDRTRLFTSAAGSTETNVTMNAAPKKTTVGSEESHRRWLEALRNGEYGEYDEDAESVASTPEPTEYEKDLVRMMPYGRPRIVKPEAPETTAVGGQKDSAVKASTKDRTIDGDDIDYILHGDSEDSKDSEDSEGGGTGVTKTKEKVLVYVGSGPRGKGSESTGATLTKEAVLKAAKQKIAAIIRGRASAVNGRTRMYNDSSVSVRDAEEEGDAEDQSGDLDVGDGSGEDGDADDEGFNHLDRSGVDGTQAAA